MDRCFWAQGKVAVSTPPTISVRYGEVIHLALRKMHTHSWETFNIAWASMGTLKPPIGNSKSCKGTGIPKPCKALDPSHLISDLAGNSALSCWLLVPSAAQIQVPGLPPCGHYEKNTPGKLVPNLALCPQTHSEKWLGETWIQMRSQLIPQS